MNISGYTHTEACSRVWHVSGRHLVEFPCRLSRDHSDLSPCHSLSLKLSQVLTHLDVI